MLGTGSGEPPYQGELAMIFPRTSFEVHSPLLNPQLEKTTNQIFPTLVLTLLNERVPLASSANKSRIVKIPGMIQILGRDQFIKANVETYLKPQEPSNVGTKITQSISPEWRQFLDQYIRASIKPEGTTGFCRYDEEGNLTGIFLRAPDPNDHDGENHFIRTFVHEITHAFSEHATMRSIMKKRFFPDQNLATPEQLKQYEELFTFYFESQFISEHFPQFANPTEDTLYKEFNRILAPLDRVLGDMYFLGKDSFLAP